MVIGGLKYRKNCKSCLLAAFTRKKLGREGEILTGLLLFYHGSLARYFPAVVYYSVGKSVTEAWSWVRQRIQVRALLGGNIYT